jgi:hypothetical protein
MRLDWLRAKMSRAGKMHLASWQSAFGYPREYPDCEQARRFRRFADLMILYRHTKGLRKRCEALINFNLCD